MQNVRVKSGTVYNMVAAAGVIVDTTGSGIYKDSAWSTFQAIVTGTGAVTVTVTIQGTNDTAADGQTPQNWCATALGVITLSGTTTATDGFTTVAPWKFVRAVTTNTTGTGATVKVLMGV